MAGMFVLFFFQDRSQGVAGTRACRGRCMGVFMTMIMIVVMSMIVMMMVVMVMAVVKFVRMSMIVDMIMVMVMMTVGTVESPQHPVGENENDDAGKKVQIRRELRSGPQHAAVRCGPRQQPDHGGMGKGRADRQDDRLEISAACSDHEGGHDAFGMARLQSVKSSQQQRRCQEEPRMRSGVLGKVDGIHGRA